jgi:hypothetical protein
MSSVVEIVLSARDAVSSIADKVAKSIKGVGDAAGDAGGQLKTIGESLSGFFDKPIESLEQLSGAIGGELLTGLGALGAAGELAAGGLALVGGAAVGTAGVIFGLADAAAKGGENVLAFSEETGIAVQNVGPLEFAVKAAGGSLDTLTGILKQIDFKSATDKSGRFAAALADIGINADSFNHMDNESKLLAIADGLRRGADSGNLMADATAIMGKQGATQIPLLMKLTDGLIKSGEKLGVTWNTEAAEKFNLGLGTIETALENVGLKIGNALLPVLSDLIDRFAQSPAFISAVTNGTVLLAHGLGYVVESVGDVVGAFGFLLTEGLRIGKWFADMDVSIGQFAVDTLTYISKIPGTTTVAAAGIATIIPFLAEAKDRQTQLASAADTTKNIFGTFFNASQQVAKALEGVSLQSTSASTTVLSLNKNVGTTALATDEWSKKVAAFKTKLEDLNKEIYNAEASGEDYNQVVADFGKKAHDAAGQAAGFGLSLSDIPGEVQDIDASFKSDVISNAIAKANEEAQKYQTTLLNTKAKAATALAGEEWKALGTDINNVASVSQLWSAKFTSSSDQATAAADKFKADWDDKIERAFKDGTISATDYAIALEEVNELHDRMISDANWAAFDKGAQMIISDFGAIASVSSGTLKTVVTSIGQGTSAVKSFADASHSFSAGGFLNDLSGISGIINGVISLGSALAGLFHDTAGRDAVTNFANSQGGFDQLHSKLDELGDAGERMWQQLSGVGQGNALQAKSAIAQVNQALQVVDFADAEGGMDQLKLKLESLGPAGEEMWQVIQTGGPAAVSMLGQAKSALDGMSQSSQNIVAELNKTPQDELKDLNSDIQKYKVSIDQLGPAWRQQNLTVEAQDLISSYTRLTGAGVKTSDVISDMSGIVTDTDGKITGFSGGLNQLLNDAISTGASLPDQFKPVLQQMIDMGDAVDANGNKITDLSQVSFSQSLDEQFKTLIDHIDDLITTLTQGLNPALLNIPSPTVTVGVNYDYGDGPAPPKNGGASGDSSGGGSPDTGDGSQPPRLGTGAYVPSPMLAIVGDAPGGEYVVPAAGLGRNYSPLPSGSGGSPTGGIELHLHLENSRFSGIDEAAAPRVGRAFAQGVLDEFKASGAMQTFLYNQLVRPMARQVGDL